MGGLWVQSSLNKGPFPGNFIKTLVALAKIDKSNFKCAVLSKIDHKSGCDSKYW